MSNRILLDCRYLDIGGAGRATELLLQGLQQLQPAGEWLLWGPPRVADFVWQGVEHRISHHHPTALAGQRDVFNVPPHDVAIYMHQIRPLLPDRSLTVVHDTIPLHFGPHLHRTLKRGFFKASLRASRLVATVSDYSASCLHRDLRLSRERIRVVRYPVDEELVSRVGDLRNRLPREERVLYVGRFGTHKNVERLLHAFAETKISRRGGRLELVGGSAAEVAVVAKLVESQSIAGVVVRGSVSQNELERLYATSACLVMPSLEEGFGLPAWEAASCGLPVCASTIDALCENVGEYTVLFDPLSITDIARAIDAVVERHDLRRPTAPSIATFASFFVESAEELSRA